jgi:hypothetical protein
MKTFIDIMDEEFPKLPILSYYPYGEKTNYTDFMGGNNNLKDLHLSDSNKGKTANDYVLAITQSAGSAMHYLTRHWEFDPTNTQTIRAFGMWELFNRGVVGWNKEITEGKSLDEIIKMEKLHTKRYSMIQYGYVGGKNPNLPDTKEYRDASRACKLSNRETYGVYEVRHYPIVSNVRTPLYTKQELAAILFMVYDEFENLC